MNADTEIEADLEAGESPSREESEECPFRVSLDAEGVFDPLD